mgnify:CR=1 FL=1
MSTAPDRLAKFKRPSRVQIVDDLPRGVTGKVQKGVLRDTLEKVVSDDRTGSG